MKSPGPYLPALRAYLPESVRFLIVKRRYPDAVREIRNIAGAATGIFLVSIPAALHVVAGEIYPTRIRSMGLGSAYAIGRVGSITGPILGGIIQMTGFSFSQFFLIFSVPSFLCVILVALYPVGARREGLEEVTAKLLK